MIELLEKWDRTLFIYLNGFHNDFFDQLMWHLSGKLEWIPLYFILFWLLVRRYGISVWKILLGTSIVILLTDQLSVHLFKNIFERYRPCHNLEIADLVHSINNKCGGKYGFVSSHASNTFGLATYIGLFLTTQKSKWILLALLIWAVLVSYSRIYLGVHYPLDVIGGAILGMLIGYFIYLVTKNVFSFKKHKNGI